MITSRMKTATTSLINVDNGKSNVKVDDGDNKVMDDDGNNKVKPQG